jgi:Bacterial Ig domain
MTSHKTNKAGLALLAATTLVVAACGSNSDDGMQTPPPAVNSAPVISGIADLTGNQDTVVGPIEFSIGDRETDASALKVSAVADGTGVVPADGITLAGSGAVRSITLTPLEAATGAVNVTLTVTDAEGAASTRAFRVTVNARNASIREAALASYAKGGADEPLVVNGITWIQDANDPAIFEPLMGTGE